MSHVWNELDTSMPVVGLIKVNLLTGSSRRVGEAFHRTMRYFSKFRRLSGVVLDVIVFAPATCVLLHCRASLRLKRGTRFAHSGGATAAAASLARQVALTLVPSSMVRV